jgi:hypothetical protein
VLGHRSLCKVSGFCVRYPDFALGYWIFLNCPDLFWLSDFVLGVGISC